MVVVVVGAGRPCCGRPSCRSRRQSKRLVGGGFGADAAVPWQQLARSRPHFRFEPWGRLLPWGSSQTEQVESPRGHDMSGAQFLRSGFAASALSGNFREPVVSLRGCEITSVE